MKEYVIALKVARKTIKYQWKQLQSVTWECKTMHLLCSFASFKQINIEKSNTNAFLYNKVLLNVYLQRIVRKNFLQDYVLHQMQI